MRSRVWRMALLMVLVMGSCSLLAQGSPYTLPPEKMVKAVALFRVRTLLYFVGAGWGILQLVLLLALGIVARFRDVAERVTRNRWGQCFLFTFLLLLATEVLNLPLRIYGHHLGLAYGLSVQGWGSWLGDMAKSFLLEWGPTGLGAMLLFWLIGRSPQRWWFWFWIPAMVSVVFGVFIAPIFIDPLYNHFEALTAHDPALVAQLEKVVARGPLVIPPDRMFWMRASDKYTGLNAYVTGIGPSKRVVVWDTSIAKATPDQISYIFGHEMGHYVLNHIYLTLIYASGLTLVVFWLGFHLARWLLRRYGRAWGIASERDWAALAVYLLVLAVLSFAIEPLNSAYSRGHEHDADVYGQEAVHGVVADPQRTAVMAFQVLGENSLEDPTPHPFVEWWMYDHPAIWKRAAFAAGYDPWVAGGQGRYFSR